MDHLRICVDLSALEQAIEKAKAAPLWDKAAAIETVADHSLAVLHSLTRAVTQLDHDLRQTPE